MSAKPRRIAITLAATDRDGICAAQQRVGAGAITINGVLASGGTVTFAVPYRIDFYSGGNISGVTFTVTGTDQYGRAATDTITGPSGGITTSTVYFLTVTAVTVSATIASDVEVGAADEIGYIYALDIYNPNVSVYVDISGTINYTLQKCGERLTAGDTPNWVAGGLATQTADNNTAYTSQTGGVRLQVNSYSTGATIAVQVNQSRYI